MKVLFLDIDGVVNCSSTPTASDGFIGIDPYMAFLVGKIQLDTQCEVVLSSSWRLFPDSLKEVEKRICKLYDVTPSNNGLTDRGCEIEAWLNEHPGVERYAILDDNTDFHADQSLFRTSWNKGLTPEIAEKVIQHFAQ